jgi:hypothetical protein
VAVTIFAVVVLLAFDLERARLGDLACARLALFFHTAFLQLGEPIAELKAQFVRRIEVPFRPGRLNVATTQSDIGRHAEERRRRLSLRNLMRTCELPP